ncbi:hypothetical protein IG631_05219 [Alternaria alternata]|nr:hypothetical protein IG631_05219 [Alternaria alternata]
MSYQASSPVSTATFAPPAAKHQMKECVDSEQLDMHTAWLVLAIMYRKEFPYPHTASDLFPGHILVPASAAWATCSDLRVPRTAKPPDVEGLDAHFPPPGPRIPATVDSR